MGGGFDADGPVASGAFFFGAMLAQTMRVWLARTPDLIHTTSTHPCLARQRCRGESASTSTSGAGAPFRFGGGRGLPKEQIEATHTHNDFTQLRAAWMHKTLLLLVWLIRVLALERKKLQ